MENDPWSRNPESPEIGALENITEHLYSEGGFIERVRALEQNVSSGTTEDIETEDIIELYSLVGDRFFNSVDCNVLALGYQLDDLKEPYGEPKMLDRSDMTLIDLESYEIGSEQKLLMLFRHTSEDDPSEYEYYGVIPNSILHMSADTEIDAYDKLGEHINDMYSTWASLQFLDMTNQERREMIHTSLRRYEEDLLYDYEDRPMQVKCLEYYELEDDRKGSSIPWNKIHIKTQDSEILTEEYYLDGYIIAVVLPEMLSSDFDRGFKSPRSFPISGGMPMVTIRDYTHDRLYFVPADSIESFRYT